MLQSSNHFLINNSHSCTFELFTAEKINQIAINCSGGLRIIIILKVFFSLVPCCFLCLLYHTCSKYTNRMRFDGKIRKKTSIAASEKNSINNDDDDDFSHIASYKFDSFIFGGFDLVFSSLCWTYTCTQTPSRKSMKND